MPRTFLDAPHLIWFLRRLPVGVSDRGRFAKLTSSVEEGSHVFCSELLDSYECWTPERLSTVVQSTAQMSCSMHQGSVQVFVLIYVRTLLAT